MSASVSTRDQLRPTSLMTPTMAPVSSMTQSPASTPCWDPLFSVRVEVQLLTACSVMRAASRSPVMSRRCSRRFSSSRSRAFSALSVSAWRMASSISASWRRRAAFSSSRAVVSL